MINDLTVAALVVLVAITVGACIWNVEQRSVSVMGHCLLVVHLLIVACSIWWHRLLCCYHFFIFVSCDVFLRGMYV